MSAPTLAPTPSEHEEVVSLELLDEFLAREEISEIIVNGLDPIWIEIGGVLQKTNQRFQAPLELQTFVRKVLSQQGRKVDFQNPFADCSFREHFRLHVAVPPVSKKGICLSIRRHSKSFKTLNALADAGLFRGKQRDILERIVLDRQNILVCGSTGAGKTTLLSALLSAVPPSERVLALEDVQEISSGHENLISLESRAANQEGEGEINLRRLLREALRMRPDRIVLGECRGSEALDLLLALSSGHHGSMATIHANSAREALHRLELLALLAAPNLNPDAVKGIIAGAIHWVAYLRKNNGRRELTSLVEVKGVDSGIFMLKEFRD